MVKSDRSSSISSENSVEVENENRTNTSYKRLKMVNSNMAYPSNSISLIPNNVKTQAAFINKLYKMLEDTETVELISWSTNGDLFSVSNPTAFSKTVLPQYFKHNNWQSFVRQLNMYGFHKVNDLIHSNLTNESQTWEFKHPHFRRGAIDDLQFIKRKSAKTHNQLLLLQHQQQLTPPSNSSTPHSFFQSPHQHQHQHQHQHPPTPPFITSVSSTPTYNDVEEHQQQEQEQPQQHSDDMSQTMARLEDQMGTISKACEVIFNELVNLRMIVSKQQCTMQDLVQVVSSPNSTVCTCENPRKNGNNRELQNAENLRLQVSKLKENFSRPDYWTNNELFQNNSNFFQQSKRLPSINYIQQQGKKADDLKSSSISDYGSSSGGENTTTTDDSVDIYQRKSSSASSSSSERDNSNSSENRSMMMGLGKRSHLLNPVLTERKEKKNIKL